MVALLGGVVVYYEHVVSFIKQYAGVVGSIGRGKPTAPPDLKLPNPSEAVQAGKGKGAAYMDRLLSSEAKAELLRANAIERLWGPERAQEQLKACLRRLLCYKKGQKKTDLEHLQKQVKIKN